MYSLWKAKEAPMISSFDSWNGLINIRKQLPPFWIIKKLLDVRLVWKEVDSKVEVGET